MYHIWYKTYYSIEQRYFKNAVNLMFDLEQKSTRASTRNIIYPRNFLIIFYVPYTKTTNSVQSLQSVHNYYIIILGRYTALYITARTDRYGEGNPKKVPRFTQEHPPTFTLLSKVMKTINSEWFIMHEHILLVLGVFH